jgi:hypothetical protein
MKIQYLITLLILGMFAQQGWAPPPGKGGAPSRIDIPKDQPGYGALNTARGASGAVGYCIIWDGSKKSVLKNVDMAECGRTGSINKSLGATYRWERELVESPTAGCQDRSCNGIPDGVSCDHRYGSVCICGNRSCH